WAEFLPPENCGFIFGNPPFGGQSYQSKNQREQMRVLTRPEGKNATPLDYVGAWFLKSATYVRQADHNIPFAFVATNSITQGEQVALLWESLLQQHNLDIIFAHKTFQWESEASGKAHVHVVIIGLEKQEHARDNRMLFSYEDSKDDPIGKSVLAISPYLFDATKLGNLANPNLIIHDVPEPIRPRRIMKRGVQPTDGGHYIFRSSDIAIFTDKEPKAKKFMRPFIGSKELIYNKKRSILYLEHATPNELAKMPFVQERIKKVIEFRKASRKPATKKSALYPTLLEGKAITTKTFLMIPETSSELREYIPMAMFAPPVIPSNAIRYIEDATPADLALLSSAMHMAWMRTVAGRLESRYRYSIGLVYNTFPLPKGKDLSKLAPFGQAILDARAKHPDTTLATLYKSSNMQSNLRRAHEANDRAVDKLYSAQPFADDTARINHLFALYEKQTAK
ncbi:MAG: class I SAM-dependent DNA methyltransferase, partial [Proteobacteria bacterium]|nr:class I SAM-dependent DNA methyltransferase [Pseudomonadota bacterium]